MNSQNSHSTEPTPRLFKPTEAAGILKVSKSKIYNLIGSGLISAVSVGTRGLRVPSSEIERIIREGTGSGA